MMLKETNPRERYQDKRNQDFIMFMRQHSQKQLQHKIRDSSVTNQSSLMKATTVFKDKSSVSLDSNVLQCPTNFLLLYTCLNWRCYLVISALFQINIFITIQQIGDHVVFFAIFRRELFALKSSFFWVFLHGSGTKTRSQ